METLGFILLWIFFVIFFLDFVLFLIYAITFLKNKTPFIPIPLSILKDIAKALELSDGSVVYDLGSGDGRILYYLAKENKNNRIVGVENNPFALILSRITYFFTKKDVRKKIKIINNDFYKEDLSSATHLISYIYPNVMDDMLVKFDRELKPGTRLVSINYQFTTKKPTREIDLKRNKYKLARKLYVYEF